MQDFWDLVVHNCFLNFNDEEVYLKLQVTNVKNKEVMATNLQLQTLEKIGLSRTLNPKP